MISVQETALREERAHLEATLRLVDEVENESKGLLSIGRTALSESVGKHMIGKRAVAEQSLRRQSELAAVLQDIRKEAYFGRLDLEYLSDGDFESIYIGKRGLWYDGEEVVVDWRSPVGNLYYGGTGQLTYESDTGEVLSCEMYLKRNLSVVGSRVKGIQDLYVLSNELGKVAEGVQPDQFLIGLLNGPSAARMKDIVKSIQQEQNSIIRADVSRAVVLQGVAGSGKTTIALHRLAYLLYAQKGKLRPEQIVVVAPSPLFLNYISDVLPSLGYKNIKQVTLNGFLLDLLPNGRSGFSRLVGWSEEERTALSVKLSAKMSMLLDRLADYAFQRCIPQRDIEVHSKQLLSRAEIIETCRSQWGKIPPAKRIKELGDYLTGLLRRDLETCKAIVRRHMDELMAARSKFVNDLESSATKRPLYEAEQLMLETLRAQINEILLFRDKELRRLELATNRFRLDYLSQLNLPGVVELYREALSGVELLRDLAGDLFPMDALVALSEAMTRRFADGAYDRADLSAVIYLNSRLNGRSDSGIKHMVVDEGQDLSPFEYTVLADVLGHPSFTIVGDLNQAIMDSGHEASSWSELVGAAFPGNQHEQLSLSVSYRNSFEITCLANQVLRNAGSVTGMAKPVPRLAGAPELIVCSGENQMVSRIKSLLDEYSRSGWENIAVLTRSAIQAEALHTALGLGKEVQLITQESQAYRGKTMILPVSLAKGLEFDCVIMVGVDKANYPSDRQSAKLLYVGITRAMHRLTILSEGQSSTLLAGAMDYVRQEVVSVREGSKRHGLGK